MLSEPLGDPINQRGGGANPGDAKNWGQGRLMGLRGRGVECVGVGGSGSVKEYVLDS